MEEVRTAMQRMYSALPAILSRPLPGGVAGILAVVAVPLWLYLQRFREALIDDTFITLQYARTLRDYGSWGFYPWEVTNTATSPLNVILTAGAGLIVPDMIQAALALATIEALILLGTLLMLSRRIFGAYAFGTMSFAAIMLNPLLISTLGLEPLLYVTLLMACIYAFALRKQTTLAVLLALLTLTRPDGFLLFPIMLGGILAGKVTTSAGSAPPAAERRARLRPFLRIALRFAGVYLLCLMPWLLFSWIELGSLLPQTLLIKLDQGNWEGYNFFNGVLFYYRRYPLEVPRALLLAPFALLCLWLRNRGATMVASVLFAFSSIYAIAYVLLGVPPYHWYFVPVVIPWSVLGVLGIAALLHWSTRHTEGPRMAGVYDLPAIVALAGMLLFVHLGNTPLVQSPIHTNWATHNRYRTIGLWLRDHVDARANVGLSGEIGTVAYYSERRLVEGFSCRVDNARIVRRIKALRGLPRLLARVNFLWLRADTACTPVTYELVMYNWPAPAREFPPNVLRHWVISTNWVAEGRVVLAQRSQPRTVASAMCRAPMSSLCSDR